MATQNNNFDVEATLQQLLDLTKPFPIATFDNIVKQFYTNGDSRYNDVIQRFSTNPMACGRVPDIVTNAQHNETKVIGLAILENAIRSRWNTFSPGDKDGMRNFVINLILTLSSDDKTMRQQRVLLAKLNVVLIEIVKYEWPHNWPTFIDDLVDSAKTSESVCINNMQILLILSEEIFDFSKNKMTSDKVTKLKQQLNSQFEAIFNLCNYVIQNSQNPTLLSATLRTLLRFLRWIPSQFILDTQLIPTLSINFFHVTAFQNHTLQCLSEIASLEYSSQHGNKYDSLFIGMITAVLEQVFKTIPLEVDLNNLHEHGNSTTQKFLSFLASFLTTFLSRHVRILEQSPSTQPIATSAFTILLRLSMIENDPAIFVVCLEFWSAFLRDLYQTELVSQDPANATGGGFFMQGNNNNTAQNNAANNNNNPSNPFASLNPGASNASRPRLELYRDTLSTLTQVLLVRMVKPEEVLVVVDELGNVQRERLENTESTTNYNTMREAFALLTSIDHRSVVDSICKQLQQVIASQEWKPHLLNRLCWAIGSISKALTENQERRFLPTVLKALLGLVDLKQRKDDKAIVAANIMYIVGQYPRFMRINYSFLSTVIDKLFQFMHEPHPGVQDMAVETFLTIAQRCRKAIVTPSPEQLAGLDISQGQSLLDNILNKIKQNTSDLSEKQQILIFYEACGAIVSAAKDAQQREVLLFRLMQIPNETWVNIVQQAKQGNVEILQQSETMEMLDLTLKTNTRVASALKQGFTPQISRIFMEMLVIYRMYSSFVSEQIQQHGENIARTTTIRLMRSVKKEILNLCTIFITNASQQDSHIVLTKFLPEINSTILQDYTTIIGAARDVEVINMYNSVLMLAKKGLQADVSTLIFSQLFPCTLQMLTTNFEDYPDHRKQIYTYLRLMTEYQLPVLFQLQQQEFKFCMDALYWGIKHLILDIEENSLTALDNLLLQIQKYPSANAFYQLYYLPTIREVLHALTDTFHSNALVHHCTVLSHLLSIVAANTITFPLQYPPEAQSKPTAGDNVSIVKQYISSLLLSSFQTTSPPQVEKFVTSLFNSLNRPPVFRQEISNFLVELKEFSRQE